MIGELPTSLVISGVSYPIRYDYRIALLIFEAYEDKELTREEQHMVCLRCLYEDHSRIPEKDLKEAIEKAIWFLDGGDMPKTENRVKTLDWKQDERMIFSAVNKTSGCECRAVPMHWWSFLGYLSEIGDCLLSTVMHIRHKRGRGEKLEKYELKVCREHSELINIKEKLTEEENKEKDIVDSLFY